MKHWPETLPLPTVEGYQVAPFEAILRTQMEAGPARHRRRFLDVPSRIEVRWVLRPDQMAIFEAWYRWEAREGAAWFEMALLGGLGLVPHQVRFCGPYRASLTKALLWEIGVALEVSERPTLSKSALALVLTENLPLLFQTLDRYHDEVQSRFLRTT